MGNHQQRELATASNHAILNPEQGPPTGAAAQSNPNNDSPMKFNTVEYVSGANNKLVLSAGGGRQVNYEQINHDNKPKTRTETDLDDLLLKDETEYYLGWYKESAIWTTQRPDTFTVDDQRTIQVHFHARLFQNLRRNKEQTDILHKSDSDADPTPLFTQKDQKNSSSRLDGKQVVIVKAHKAITMGQVLDFCNQLLNQAIQIVQGDQLGLLPSEDQSAALNLLGQNLQKLNLNLNQKWLSQPNKIVAFRGLSYEQREAFCFEYYLTQKTLSLQRLSKNIDTHVEPVLSPLQMDQNHVSDKERGIFAGAFLSTELLKTPQMCSIDNFQLVKQIGKGGFSQVLLARQRDTGTLCAMKVIAKQEVLQHSKVDSVFLERDILASLQSPFIVQLQGSFQTNDFLYFVLEFCPAGELFYHLSSKKHFHEDEARIVIAEVILAIEYLHEHNIIYRDLKPENILVDFYGHIKLTDFGLCKKNFTRRDRSDSLCGSPEYICPEMLNSGTHGQMLDFYQVGALLYELLVGLPPNYSSDKRQLFTNIAKIEANYPETLSHNASSLLRGLLNKNPQQRLGYTAGWDGVKSHPFFAKINWNEIYVKSKVGPLRPQLMGAYFDQEYMEDLSPKTLKTLSQVNLLTISQQKSRPQLKRLRSYQNARDDLVLYRSSRILLHKADIVLNTELVEAQAGGSMSHRLPIIENIIMEEEDQTDDNQQSLLHLRQQASKKVVVNIETQTSVLSRRSKSKPVVLVATPSETTNQRYPAIATGEEFHQQQSKSRMQLQQQMDKGPNRASNITQFSQQKRQFIDLTASPENQNSHKQHRKSISKIGSESRRSIQSTKNVGAEFENSEAYVTKEPLDESNDSIQLLNNNEPIGSTTSAGQPMSVQQAYSQMSTSNKGSSSLQNVKGRSKISRKKQMISPQVDSLRAREVDSHTMTTFAQQRHKVQQQLRIHTKMDQTPSQRMKGETNSPLLTSNNTPPKSGIRHTIMRRETTHAPDYNEEGHLPTENAYNSSRQFVKQSALISNSKTNTNSNTAALFTTAEKQHQHISVTERKAQNQPQRLNLAQLVAPKLQVQQVDQTSDKLLRTPPNKKEEILEVSVYGAPHLKTPSNPRQKDTPSSAQLRSNLQINLQMSNESSPVEPPSGRKSRNEALASKDQSMAKLVKQHTLDHVQSATLQKLGGGKLRSSLLRVATKKSEHTRHTGYHNQGSVVMAHFGAFSLISDDLSDVPGDNEPIKLEESSLAIQEGEIEAENTERELMPTIHEIKESHIQVGSTMPSGNKVDEKSSSTPFAPSTNNYVMDHMTLDDSKQTNYPAIGRKSSPVKLSHSKTPQKSKTTKAHFVSHKKTKSSSLIQPSAPGLQSYSKVTTSVPNTVKSFQQAQHIYMQELKSVEKKLNKVQSSTFMKRSDQKRTSAATKLMASQITFNKSPLRGQASPLKSNGIPSLNSAQKFDEKFSQSTTLRRSTLSRQVSTASRATLHEPNASIKKHLISSKAGEMKTFRPTATMLQSQSSIQSHRKLVMYTPIKSAQSKLQQSSTRQTLNTSINNSVNLSYSKLMSSPKNQNQTAAGGVVRTSTSRTPLRGTHLQNSKSHLVTPDIKQSSGAPGLTKTNTMLQQKLKRKSTGGSHNWQNQSSMQKVISQTLLEQPSQQQPLSSQKKLQFTGSNTKNELQQPRHIKAKTAFVNSASAAGVSGAPSKLSSRLMPQTSYSKRQAAMGSGLISSNSLASLNSSALQGKIRALSKSHSKQLI